MINHPITRCNNDSCDKNKKCKRYLSEDKCEIHYFELENGKCSYFIENVIPVVNIPDKESQEKITVHKKWSNKNT